MNIGINGYEAVVPRFGFLKSGFPNRVGSGEFCYQLLVNFKRIDYKNEYQIFLPTKPSLDLPPENDRWKYKVHIAKRMWTLVGLSKILRNEKIDVFFSPTHYLPLSCTRNSVIAIFDLSYLRFPKMYNKKDLVKLKVWGGISVRKAKRIVTISESSRNDIIEAYGVKPEKVRVVYPGIKPTLPSRMSLEDMNEAFGIKGKYILFVGTLQPRKNIAKLIEAFSDLNDKEMSLVIVGKKGWQYDQIMGAPKKFGVEERVKFLEKVSDEDLPSLYKHAEFFILPSLYEGFGLPVLEAMSYGCPVITSNISSLPEAGGDAALYVDPKDVKDITEKMNRLLEDDKLRRELSEKGKEQIKKFSWEKSAKEVLAVLEEAANE
jgi:glycosyltransferase involved in cell wall biosynthesis